MGVCTLGESGFGNADVVSLEEGIRAWLLARRHPGAGCGQFGLHLGPRRAEAFYIRWETDVSGSTECVWAQSVALPDVVANKMECLLLKVG